jgi:hypothetical protein
LGNRFLNRTHNQEIEIKRLEVSDNIKMDPLAIGLGGVDWIGLAQDRDKWRALVNAVMNLWVP